ncbi:hypothetical protein ACM64Y_12040 [Novispirillum sp. DQ9]|uniref:hypothetical protein n=1 Tax=Novispirillum sp. DQ9 TaxID=3398612 RepID=UPI003C7EA56E
MIRSCTLAFLCLLIAGTALPAQAQAPAHAQASPPFQTVREVYAQARDGTADPEQARAVIEAYLEDHPAQPVATAYLGSVRAMMARDSFFPFTKLNHVTQGLELLDDAVEHLDHAEVTADHDGRLDVLLVSGLTNAAVPKAFGRRAMAERDLSRARGLPSFHAVPAATKAKVYAWLAVFAAPRDAAEADALLSLARAEDRAVADALWTEER